MIFYKIKNSYVLHGVVFKWKYFFFHAIYSDDSFLSSVYFQILSTYLLTQLHTPSFSLPLKENKSIIKQTTNQNFKMDKEEIV